MCRYPTKVPTATKCFLRIGTIWQRRSSPRERLETAVPRDAEGQPVRGLFNDDPVVDFDATLLEGAFDPLFDLNGNGRVDFDNFFIFADSFGREAVTD